MIDRKGRRVIMVNKSDHDRRRWWTNTWKSHGFETWTDAKGWLWDDYKAEVYNTKDGFCISFLYEEDFVLFFLTHASCCSLERA